MDKDKKVVLFSVTLNVGGGERHLAAVANGLHELGAQVKIVLVGNPKVAFELHDGIEVIYLKNDDKDYDISKNAVAVKEIPCEQPSNIGLFNRIKFSLYKKYSPKRFKLLDKEIYLENTFSSKVRSFLRDCPDWVVVSFMSDCNVSVMKALKDLPNRGLFVEFTSPVLEFAPDDPMNVLKKRYFPRANGAIFQTDEERDFYTFLDCPKYVIPNPICGTCPERFVGTRKKEIVSFARLEKDKNFPMLFDAFAMLLKEYPDYSLSIYGDGHEKNRLVKYARQLGIASNVVFHGFDVNLHGKINDCAMFVSSSDREGISNSMLEAMAIGLPCVCTDCPAGGARMMIKPYENGLLVPVKDKTAMYKAMKEIVENPELAERMSANAVKIKERLSPDKISRQWMDAIWDR